MARWTSQFTRARDADRDAAVAKLRDALIDGQLTSDEFDTRMGKVLEARRLADVAAQLDDLQGNTDLPGEVADDGSGGGITVASGISTARRPSKNAIIGLAVASAIVAGGIAIGATVSSRDAGGTTIDAVGGERPDQESGAVAYGTPLDSLKDNPVAFFDLYGPAETTWAQLGAPPNIPYPVFATENGRSWLTSDNTVVDGSTVYHWHIEYTLSSSDSFELVPRHVGDFYAATTDPRAFGDLVRVSTADREELTWGGDRGPAEYSIALVAEPDGTPGVVRVALDITGGIRPPLDEPDVPGALSRTLADHRIPTRAGMTYVRSKVGQVAGQTWVCDTTQVWTAPADSIDKLRDFFGRPESFSGTDVGNPEGPIDDLDDGTGFVKNTAGPRTDAPERIVVQRDGAGVTIRYERRIDFCTELDF